MLLICLGCFSGYIVLEKLYISDSHLFGIETCPITQPLPVSLRLLHVTDCCFLINGMGSSSRLKELAETNHANKGPLELVYISSEIRTYIHHEEWMDIQRACATHGLEVKIWEYRHVKDITTTAHGLRSKS